MVNWKGFGRKLLYNIQKFAWRDLEMSRKPQNRRHPVEIRTDNLPNTSLVLYLTD
jgi:hypothetical protein